MKLPKTRIFAFLIAAIALVSGCDCSRINPDNIKYDQVLILYSAGYNSLSTYLNSDIQDLQKGYVPSIQDKKVVLIVSHQPASAGDYTTPTCPQILRLSYTTKGNAGIVLEPVKQYPEGTILADAETMKSILKDISKQYKSNHYGMIFSSHSTGWLPSGYYSAPDKYDMVKTSASSSMRTARQVLPAGAVPYVEEYDMPGMPAVRSIGQSNSVVDGEKIAYEMDLPQFAESIPMHLDYLIFDACLTGGIEVAYQLRDVCDLVSFSQTEVLAEGLDYTKLLSHLFEDNSNVVAVARDYFNYYNDQKDGTYKSATISVVDCTKLDALASVCKALFSEYAGNIAAINPDKVQRYYRNTLSGNGKIVEHHWYYDLEDILIKAGASTDEQKQLTNALKSCIRYKAATPSFMNTFDIRVHSGFSMYLPCNGSQYLDDFYRNLAWNKATELVN